MDLTFRKSNKTRGFLPFCTGILDILGCALGPLIFGFNLHRLSRLNFGQDHPTLQDFTVNTVQIEDIGVQSAQTASKKHQQSTSCTRHFLLFKALLGNHQNCTFCLKYSKHFFYLCVADYKYFWVLLLWRTGLKKEFCEVDQAKQRFAQLYLVDLAGSERVMKTGVQGMQLEEVGADMF